MTGATSALTSGQRSHLDGSTVEAMIGRQVGTCAAMWFDCQAMIRDPGGHWDLDDASDAAAYEATRYAYRHLLAQRNTGTVGLNRLGVLSLNAHPEWLVGVDQAAVDVTGNRAAIQSYWFRDPGVAVGVDAGCWALVCLQVGLDSGGPFANIGAGVAIASPGVIISGSDNDYAARQENQFFLSADAGPFSIVAGRWVWGDDEFVRDGTLQGPSIGISIPTPFPVGGGGYVHWWRFG